MKKKRRLQAFFMALVMAIPVLQIYIPGYDVFRDVQRAKAAGKIFWPVPSSLPGSRKLNQGFHDGNAIDIGGSAGCEIVAAMGGKVRVVYRCTQQHFGSNHDSSCYGFGTGVVIDGDDGRIYQYAHMQANSVPEDVYNGASVRMGQKIGCMGKTGNASGVHLHFGISIGGIWNKSGINPDPENGTESYIYTLDSQSPVISNVNVTNVTSEGYTVSCTVTDNVGVTKVLFPTWKSSEGSGGCEWYEGSKSGDTYTFTFRDGRAEGWYMTHIYAWDAAENSTMTGTSGAYIDKTAPVITDVQVTDVDSDGYTVTCTVTDNIGVDRVQFPTWTVNNGQDDLLSGWGTDLWARGTKNGDSYSYRVKRSEHNNEFGTYVTHIYAFDSAGNHTACSAPTVEILEATVEPTEMPAVQSDSQLTVEPSAAPTALPSSQPSDLPTALPSDLPSATPIVEPTVAPTVQPSSQPSVSPTISPISFATIQPDVEHINFDWEEVSDGTGIEVQYAENPDMENAESRFWVGGIGGRVTNLKSDTPYYLRIRAYQQMNDVTQYSEWSNVETVKTIAPTLPKFDVISVTPDENSILLIWGEAEDITGYQVQYAENADMTGFAIMQWTYSEEYQGVRLGDLEEGTTYYLRSRVYREVNGTCEYSPWSEKKVVTIPSSGYSESLPKVVITSIVPDVEYIQFYWEEVTGVDGFEIQYCTKADKSDAKSGYWNDGTVLGGRLTGTGKLSENTTYYFRIRTYKVENGTERYSEWTEWKSATTKSRTVTVVPSAAPTPTVTPSPTATPKPSNNSYYIDDDDDDDDDWYSDNSSSSSVKKPKKITGVSAKNKKGKKLVVSWKWTTDVSGFQIQYALNKKFTKGKKTVKVGKYTSSKTIKVSKKKTYYVRVRAYNKKSRNIRYGNWSKVKKVKIKV